MNARVVNVSIGFRLLVSLKTGMSCPENQSAISRKSRAVSRSSSSHLSRFRFHSAAQHGRTIQPGSIAGLFVGRDSGSGASSLRRCGALAAAGKRVTGSLTTCTVRPLKQTSTSDLVTIPAPPITFFWQALANASAGFESDEVGRAIPQCSVLNILVTDNPNSPVATVPPLYIHQFPIGGQARFFLSVHLPLETHALTRHWGDSCSLRSSLRLQSYRMEQTIPRAFSSGRQIWPL